MINGERRQKRRKIGLTGTAEKIQRRQKQKKRQDVRGRFLCKMGWQRAEKTEWHEKGNSALVKEKKKDAKRVSIEGVLRQEERN